MTPFVRLALALGTIGLTVGASCAVAKVPRTQPLAATPATPAASVVAASITTGAISVEAPRGPVLLATQVATSLTHACALTEDGHVRCWGGGNSSWLGAAKGDESEVVLVNGLASIAGVAVGAVFSCALASTGKVLCWGENALGQLGDGTRTSRSSPARVPGLDDVVQIAAGGSYACARKRSGDVMCWGGDPRVSAGPHGGLTPALVASDATAIAIGEQHACLLRRDRSVGCWGENGSAQLGDGTRERKRIPARVVDLSDVVELAVGDGHTCVRRADASIACWGRNDQAQVTGHVSEPVAVPTRVERLGEAIGIHAGGLDSCARLVGGELRCWSTYLTKPASLGALPKIAGLAIASGTACALAADHTVRCWGDGNGHKLGRDVVDNRVVPTLVTGVRDVVQIGAGSAGTCVRTTQGEAYCWGTAGSLGTGVFPQRHRPVRIPSVSGVKGLALGEAAVCLMDREGTSCAGTDLPESPAGARDGFAHRPELGGALQIALGRQIGCWMGAKAPVICWTNAKPRPREVKLADVADIHVGYTFACARHYDGTVSCWGDGAPQSPSDVPRQVAGLAGVEHLALEAETACALLRSGQVTCWNPNAPPVFTKRALPGRAVELAAGTLHSCARLDTGEIHCWGRNQEGQLGRPVDYNLLQPAVVPGLRGVAGLALGAYHSCARLDDGTVKCWGGNAFGDLGVGPNVEPREWIPAPVELR